ncbi:hypothetical protein RRG08_021383 [Elysia crispata]|uniref:Sulfotransferase domain-containing protein n=1 Tax=Elysia crispata TaxID=231223 RepID=A0AAE1BDT1_9GAST|nr:hypothetical protein RRG08_021383 [Elysia crispata]
MTSVIEAIGVANQDTNGLLEKTNPKSDTAELPAPDPNNPFYFPALTLPSGLLFNRVRVMKCPVKDDPMTHLKKIYDLPMRDDDIIITAYPKCGTHWVAEILHMLTSGATEFSGRTKEYTMLEFCNDLRFLATLSSPRLLNSHLYMAQLPRGIVVKKVKIIHVIRNPKDTAVSMYHHLKHQASEQFTFDNFLKGYPCGDYFVFSHQFDYLRQMAEFEKSHPDHPIMHIHYEDLKQDPANIIKELSQFIGTPASDDFCQRVAAACGFSNMRKEDPTREIPESLRNLMKKRMEVYRKGVVGDWKNHFTVAQSEAFDEFLAEQKQKGFGFTPRGEF